jgi:hypothetical protein
MAYLLFRIKKLNLAWDFEFKMPKLGESIITLQLPAQQESLKLCGRLHLILWQIIWCYINYR